jgi:diacylglycerol kinase (ATP)
MPEASGRGESLFAIINPVSCPAGGDGMRQELVQALARHGLTAQFMETCESETAFPLAKKAIEQGAKMILAVGGDGTIMETINAAAGTEIPVGIVPAGTGNLLANNLKIPLTVDGAVDVAITGVSRRLDLISLNKGRKYFAVMGGLGYDAEIMRETPREVKRRIGKLAYLWTALKELRGKRFHVDIVLADRTVSERAKSLIIANMGDLGGGLALFPDADPFDGKFEIGIIKASDVPSFLLLAWHTLRGRPTDSPHFDQYEATRVVVRSRRMMPLELDGDVQDDVSSLEAEIVPKAALVMMPGPVQP